MKWIKGVAAILSMGLFLGAVVITLIFLWADDFLGRIVRYISRKIK